MSKGMNNEQVLKNVQELIRKAEEGKRTEKVWSYGRGFGAKTRTVYPKYKIREVCNQLSIFDWWNEELSVHQLKQMEKFLETAAKLGFNGYVCFKVGAKGCSHGMWAHKAESETGYSPDGECLHHSFRTGDNYWDYCNAENKWMANRERWQFTLDEVKQAMAQ